MTKRSSKFKRTELGMVPEDWEIKAAEECMESIIDYRGKTPRKSPSGVPLITARIVKGGYIDYSNCEYIRNEDYDSWMRRGMPREGDIVLTTEGPLGEVAQLDGRKVALAQRILTLRGKKDVLDNAYLKYFLISRMGQSELHSRATGTTVQGIKQREFRQIRLLLPTVAEQHNIAKIPSSVDSRIELNQQMNQNLEEIGQALFKRWFINFEFPNEEGKPYKTSGEEMVYNEAFAMEIPKGWKVEELPEIGDVIDCLHTMKPPAQPSENILLQVYNFGIESSIDLSDRYTISDRDYEEWIQNIEVKEGDILLTNAGLVGAVARVPHYFKGAIGRNITAVRPTKVSAIFLFRYLLSEYGKTEVERNTDSGTIFNVLNVKGIRKIRVLVSPKGISTRFEHLILPLRKKLENNLVQNQTLSKIRETLLPKLMSGKIRVPEAT